ncbi:MAG: uracil-DNA glycosylase [Clostridia bacterium]|nr:uracil-DNA glycosylase [Clostridia bacterium]
MGNVDLNEWKLFEEECKNCGNCDLRKGATNTVIYRGSLNAPLMVIGEAPGESEDLQGKPFVGRSGQLLQNLLASFGLSDENYHICNICKCRPPQNRRPTAEEIKACKRLLAKQFKLVGPKVILLCGSTAYEAFFNPPTKPRMGDVRGKFIEKNGILIMTTYHPAFLLRNPSSKVYMYDDVKLVVDKLKEMGLYDDKSQEKTR